MQKTFITILSVIFFSGCANNFAETYKPYDGLKTLSPLDKKESVEIIDVKENPDKVNKILREGFSPIGSSRFVARDMSQQIVDIEKQARAIGAKVAVLEKKDAGSGTVVQPYVTPTQVTSTTNLHQNIYSNKGYLGNIQGNATTSSYGTSTQYVPVHVNFKEYIVTYYSKTPNNIGVYVDDLSDNEKQLIGSNTGVKVIAVIDNSPAYFGNILPNDLILEVNGSKLAGAKGFNKVNGELLKGKVDLMILRSSKVISKQIELN